MAKQKRQRHQKKNQIEEKQNETNQIQLKKRFHYLKLLLFIYSSILVIIFSNEKSYLYVKSILNCGPPLESIFSSLLFSSFMIIKEKIKEVEGKKVQLEKEMNQRVILQ